MTTTTAPRAGAPPPEAIAAAHAAERRRGRRRQRNAHATLLPATLWLTIFLLVPLGMIVVCAVAGRPGELFGTQVGSPTTSNLSGAVAGAYPTSFLRAMLGRRVRADTPYVGPDHAP